MTNDDSDAAKAGARPASDDRPVCPRCDHDLRGERLAWRDACPLRGQCSECALAFAWGDLLSGRLHYSRWSIEGAPGPITWAGRTVRQLAVATFLPRLIVRRLRLEHGIRPLRLVAGLSLPVAVLAVLVVLVAARGYVRVGVPFDRAVIAVLDLPPDEGTLLLHLGRWIVLPMVVAGTWWTWAARLYLRMDRPALVGWSVAAVATFVSTVATQLVRGII